METRSKEIEKIFFPRLNFGSPFHSILKNMKGANYRPQVILLITPCLSRFIYFDLVPEAREKGSHLLFFPNLIPFGSGKVLPHSSYGILE